MKNSEIFDVVHDYVVFATGLPGRNVRITRPNYGVNPAKDRETIVTIGLINSTQIGIDNRLYRDKESSEDMTEYISSDRNITASIKAYGKDAADVMDQISFKTRTQAGNEILIEGGLGYLGQGQVLTLSEVLNGSYEEIRQLDLDFHVDHITEADINAIDSATIGVEVQYDTRKLNKTIEVTK